MQELLEGETVNVSVQKYYEAQEFLILIIHIFFMGIVTFKNGWPKRYRF